MVQNVWDDKMLAKLQPGEASFDDSAHMVHLHTGGQARGYEYHAKAKDGRPYHGVAKTREAARQRCLEITA